MPTVVHEEGFLQSFDGTRLFYEWHPALRSPWGESPPITVLSHGLGEHQGRYGRLKELFVRHGISVLAFDHRGHGRSEGKRGYAPGLLYFVQDLLQMVQQAHSLGRRKTLPVTLFGHSFGGLVAALFALQFPDRVEQLILSSPALGIHTWVPFPRQVTALLARLWPEACLFYPIFPVLLTHDPEARHALATDPLRHSKIGVKLARDMIEYGAYVVVNAGKVSCPLLVLQAERDWVVKASRSVAFFEGAASAVKQKEVLAGMYHEVLNERNAELAYSAVEAFLRSSER